MVINGEVLICSHKIKTKKYPKFCNTQNQEKYLRGNVDILNHILAQFVTLLDTDKLYKEYTSRTQSYVHIYLCITKCIIPPREQE